MNTLIISDLHIAANAQLPNKKCTLDNNILRFLDYYSNNRVNNEPWTLIINGDAIDFMAVSVYSTDLSNISLDDRLHGLGTTCEKSKFKLKVIIEHYHKFFFALAKFVASGNQLKIISGNHDLELAFEELQQVFIDELYKFIDHDYKKFSDSIKFYPWFYYEPNLLYVEHGNQYDDYCSTDYPLALMDNKTDIVPSISHVGMRYFVNKIPNYDPSKAEEWGFKEYIKWSYNIGIKKALFSLLNYMILVLETLFLWQKLRSTDKERRNINDKELNLYAKSSFVSIAKIKKLYSLHRSPVTRSLFAIASTYFIDRMFLMFVASIGIILLPVYLHSHWKIITPIAVIVFGYLLNKIFNKIRFNASSSVKLREAAKKISNILPSQIITFGHSHAPEVSAFQNGTTYINTGSWTEDGKYTYVMITHDAYELKYWRE